MKNQEEMRTLVLDGCFLDQQKARDIPGPGFLIHMYDLAFYREISTTLFLTPNILIP